MKLKDGMTLMATAIAHGRWRWDVGRGCDGRCRRRVGHRARNGRRRGLPDSKIGLAIMAGGGVTDFTEGTTRNETTVGGSWDVRALVATRTWIGFEASYIGGANPIKALGVSGNSKLVRNGVEGALRVQLPLYHGSTLLEPYVVAGVGWNSYRVTYVNTYSASVTTSGDNTVAVPLGVGFMVGYKGVRGRLALHAPPDLPADDPRQPRGEPASPTGTRAR